MKKTSLVATLTSPPSADGSEVRRLPPGVDHLEVRADLVGELDPDWLRQHFAGRLIYTLRSRAEGGAHGGDSDQRLRRLGDAAEHFDLVDLEGDRDLDPALLKKVPAEKRLLSWHGTVTHLTALRQRFERLAATEARYYKLIPTATQTGEGLKPLLMLRSLGRDDVVSFAGGESGAWTRLIAPRLGSPLTYGAAGEVRGAPGQLTVEQLTVDYGLPDLPAAERLYGIVGYPVMHSLSPRLHNGAYRELGLDALYVPFHADSFGDFWLDLVEEGSLELFGLPLAGLSVTAPYKELALDVSGVSSPRAQHIGAANTLVRDAEGVWEAETTDPEGIAHLLAASGVELHGSQAAVVGCGGAGKAGAYGLELAGTRVTLVNRGRERGEQASREMHLPFVPLRDFDPRAYDIVVNATALGHHEDDPLPFDLDRLKPGSAVVDMVYGDGPTRLVNEARRRGHPAFGGRRVLLYQAFEQFRLMTGHRLGEPLARRLLGIDDDHDATHHNLEADNLENRS